MHSSYETRIKRCDHRSSDMKIGDIFGFKKVKKNSATTLG